MNALLEKPCTGDLPDAAQDHLGSVRATVNSSGAIQTTSTFNEFGLMTPVSQASGSPFLDKSLAFVGGLGVRNEPGTPANQPSGSNNGLLLMGQRWYDPNLAIFLSHDPIGFAGGLNLYGYAGANPIRFVDPSGLILTIDTDDPEDTSAASLLAGFFQTQAGIGVSPTGGRIDSVGFTKDATMRNLLQALITSKKTYNIRARNLSSATNIGGCAGQGAQTIDIGDILEVAKKNGGLANSLLDIELAELLNSTGFPVPTNADELTALHGHLHPLGLKASAAAGFRRISDSTSTVAGFQSYLETGAATLIYQNLTFTFTGNKEGSFPCSIKRR